MSRREEAIAAVVTLVTAALPLALVVRNQERADEIGGGGFVNIIDGDPGDPEITLSPLTYTYDHPIGLELAAIGSADMTKEQALDAMGAAIGRAVAADRTLGNIVEFAQVTALNTDNANAAGTDTIRWGDGAVIVQYTTKSPMG